ncbi:superoxide dismutase family protein [Oceanobacillus halotolerans]|uniref:superoxide dismutase family protein n=1 Tax=Oceanobacillus halotolerans TaxID=2663380 RepID=UPI0013DD225F|nr:superoxide dismutase family protein [Oceanobacillus halotolerans]
MRRLFFLIVLIFLMSCQSNGETARTIDMYNSDGDMIGTAALKESPDGVEVKLKLEGLKPGYHGIHVHEFPKCEGPEFKSAGNHFNPDGSEHGLMHPEGSHLGDMPNIEADGGGLVDADLTIPEATLLDGKNSLLEGEGTSIVIHENQDDGVSQPGGNSGARIACGEIKRDQGDSTNSPTDPTQSNEEQQE